MKIGFDAKRAFQNRTGLGNYSRSMISMLNRYYPEHSLLAFSPKTSISEWTRGLSLKTITPRGAAKLLPSWWRRSMITKEIQEQGIDVYHGLSHELPLGIEKLQVKSCVSIHDLIFFRYPELYTWIDRQSYTRKFKHACQVADKVIAISEQTKRDLLEYLDVDPKKIVVHYQSCDSSFYTSPSEQKLGQIRTRYQLPEKYILNVGTIEPRKNVLTLIKAFHQIQDEIADFKLVLVGKGKRYQKKVEDYIEKYGLQSRVMILSYLPFEDLPAIYHMASLFAYPSFFEGFGIPLIEAQYQGTPLIVSTGSCFSETAGPHSLYCDPSDVEQWSNALEQLINDTVKQEEMISRGKEYVQRFHEKEVVKQLLHIYQSL